MMKKIIFVLFLILFAAVFPCFAQDPQPEQKDPIVCPVCLDLTGRLTYEGCMIKGNINSKGEKIYHCPRWRDYKKTVIDKDDGERWFCTEAEAREAGWRSPKYNTGPCR